MDPDLLGNLLDQHAAALELFARQWCDVPEDVVQDAFLKLAARRALPDNPAAWLFRVVRNGAIEAGQAARRRKRYETAAASWAPPCQFRGHLPVPGTPYLIFFSSGDTILNFFASSGDTMASSGDTILNFSSSGDTILSSSGDTILNFFG